MGKKIIFILACLLLVVCVAGCGEKTPTYEWEVYYEEADYEKYKTPASENGLEDTLIWVEGKIIEKNVLEEIAFYMLEDKNKNSWMLCLSSLSKQTLSIGEHVKAYGAYMGVSELINNTPSIVLLRYIKENKLTNIAIDGLELYTHYEEDLQKNAANTEQYKTISHNDISFKYNKKYSYEEIDGRAYVYFDDDAFMVINIHNDNDEEISEYKANLFFEGARQSISKYFEEVQPEEIQTQLLVAGKTAFMAETKLINGKESFYGDFQMANTIFPCNGKIYSIDYLASKYSYDKYYYDYKDILKSITANS